MALLDILQQLFGGGAPSQNRLMMAAQGPNAEDRPGFMPAGPQWGMAGRQNIDMPLMPSGPQSAPQAAQIAPPQASQPGFLERLINPNAGAQNKTMEWLTTRGYTPEQSQVIMSDKRMLQQALQDYAMPKQTDPLDTELKQLTIEGKRKELNAPPPDNRTANEREFAAAKADGSFKGTFTDWQTKGIREQDPTFQREMDLRQQYDALPEVKDYKVVKSNFERIRQGVEMGTGAGDAAIVFGYMKMLDPGSVVREGEQASARNAAGVPETVRGLYNSLVGGGTISAEARNQILAAAQKVYGESATNIEELNTRYSGYAGAYKLDPNRVVSPVEKYDPMEWNETEIPGVKIRRK